MKYKLLLALSTNIAFFNIVFAQTLIFKNGFEIFIPNPLNDTGINWGGNYSSSNNGTCASNISSLQDCNQGRDATHNDDSDGHAGFSFTKLDATGARLVDQSVDYVTTPWSCVRDNVTGLVWEVKTTDGGLHDKNDKYNWYNTDSFTNGGADGYFDNYGNICFGYNASDSSTFCNTQAFTARVNSQSLCGQTDWRVPNINELHSIVHQGIISPAIDTNYFPNTKVSLFWSSSSDAQFSDFALALYFTFGNDGSYSRVGSYYVRLVRGGQ